MSFSSFQRQVHAHHFMISVYALHNMLLKLATFKLVGYFVATSGRQRTCNSNLVSFSFSMTDELSSALSCFSP